MKRSKKLRKASKLPQPRLERQVWELCKQIIRLRHGNVCYTCGAPNLAGSNWHTGHMWPKAALGALMKYDLRILRPQCYRCNIHLGGNGARFYARMTSEIGQSDMATLTILRDSSKLARTRAYAHYLMLKEQYQEELKKPSVKPDFRVLLSL